MAEIYSPKHAYLLVKNSKQQELPPQVLIDTVHQFILAELKTCSSLFIEHAIQSMQSQDNIELNSEHFVEFKQAVSVLTAKKMNCISLIQQTLSNLTVDNDVSDKAEGLGRFSAFTSSSKGPSLSLVDDDQLEREYTKTGFLSNLTPITQISLKQLDKRFEHLNEQLSGVKKGFRMSAWHIGQAYTKGVDSLECGFHSEQRVYEELESVLHSALPLIFAYVNCFLIEHKVCPDLAVTGIDEDGNEFEISNEQREDYLSRVKHTEYVELPAHLTNALPIAAYGAAFNVISQLLDANKGKVDANLKPQFELPQIFNALNAVQHSEEYEDISSNVVDFRKVLKNQVPEIEQVDRAAIGHSSDDMIDVVSIMFNFILKNEYISKEVRQQIARLQVPFLKLALIEPEFFKDKQHPARMLLNSMAKQGVSIGPSPNKADQIIIDKVKTIVSTIVKDFNGETEIFTKQREAFEQLVAGEQKRSKVIINRTKLAESGKAKFEQANLVVSKVIDRILDNQVISKSSIDIVRQTLQPAAVYLYLKYGPKDQKVVTAVKSVKQMILSVLLEKKTAMTITKPQKQQINNAIENLLTEFLSDKKQIDSVMAKIKEQQILAVNKQCQDKIKVKIEKEEPEHSNPSVSPKYLKMAQEVPIGSWVDVKQEQDWMRARLIARLRTSKKMLFVNRVGVKACEFIEDEFAANLEQQDIQIVKNEAVFEKALESVVINLKNMRREKERLTA